MKKLLTVILTLFIVLGSFSVCFATAPMFFYDVQQNTEEGQCIFKLAEAKIICGDGNGYFRPNDTLTRAELCKMINLTFGFTQIGENIFSDVINDEEHWYYEQVLIAVNSGYIKGFEDGTFRGEDNVSREQVCAIIDRILNESADISNVEISDEISDWAEENVKNMIANNHFKLEADNRFRATEDIKRKELAVALAPLVKEKSDSTDTEINSGSSGSGSSGSGSSGSGSSGSGSSESGSSETENPPDEEPQGPTEEEIAESKKICEELRSIVNAAEPIEFQGDAADIMKMLISDINEALEMADDGSILITKKYIRETYAEDINSIKESVSAMNEEEKEACKLEFMKLDTASMMRLIKYFNINMDFFE